MARIFLSSSFVELQNYRAAAAETVHFCDHACVQMETFAAAIQEIDAVCKTKIESCDLFVLLLGKLYGSLVPGTGVSYTEYEFSVARELNRKPLVFVASPKAVTDFEAVFRANQDRLDPALARRQAAFTKRACEGGLPVFFDDPADLQRKLTKTLAEALAASVRVLVPQPVKIVPPEDLPIRCNRTTQIEEFTDTFFGHEPGVPHLCAIYGLEQQQHKSCVRRLVREHLGSEEGVASSLILPEEKRALIEWPETAEDGPEIVLNRLRRRLCQVLQPQNGWCGSNTTEDFCKLTMQAGSKTFRFRHVFLAEAWTVEVQEFCANQYLGFWNSVRKEFAKYSPDQRPRILVFFEMKHKIETTEGRHGLRENLRRVFLESPEGLGLGRQVLSELGHVKLDHLDIWREKYGQFLLPEYRTQKLEDLFPNPPLLMAHVEDRLRTYVGLENYGS